MFRRLINCCFPAIKTTGLGKGVYRDIYFPAFVLRITDCLVKAAVSKVQSGKVPRVGIILETHINGISTVINRRFQ